MHGRIHTEVIVINILVLLLGVAAYLKDAKVDVLSMRNRFLMLTFQERWHVCAGCILEPRIYSL